ncbi:MAG: hypothetical protein JWP44_3737 [Mucilaginibacter sp.]|nr:hypothetical protein [Mucilaginibacter sp.]
MTTETQALPKGFVRLSGPAAEVEDQLGPLASLVGTWRGNTGWNMIAVPARQPDGNPTFKLLVQNYSETITFTPIGAPVPNRGGVDEQFITGLVYNLTVTDNTTEGILHIENGMWLYMGDIKPQPVGLLQDAPLPIQYAIARQSSIPHGDVVIALGNAVTSTGKPTIPIIDGLPPDIGYPTLRGYLDPYLNTGFRQFNAKNPNMILEEALQNQTIGKVTTITVDTTNHGGSIVNIPFIDQHVNPSRFVSTFWIEEVFTDNVNFLQLQYSQQADLNFLPKFNAPGIIMWPHVNVNTLRKQ